jgi:hypothetical protein
MRRHNFILAGAVALVAGGWSAAFAGGLGDDNGEGKDSIFFGVVKDTRGAAIAGARVNVKFKSLSFVTVTDVIGGYRIATTTDPEQSEVTCSKDGYRPGGTTRRTPPGAQTGPIEIDCTLQRAP